MLKINKILSKKIKSPLSLRGAFLHVIARERSDRSNLNLSGFSLIELMIAVTILALAIFGIFHAYSVGFLGMADARDRTVATNYLQQTIEDFKNMDFIQVKNEPITPIPNTKFSRGTYVLNLEEIDGVVTLKKVISQVRWVDRKGNIKTEKTSTIIYNKPATSEAGDVAIELVLYAQSYYTIMPTNEVNLVAKIKDENGNIYDYDGEIEFSVVTVRIDGIPIQVGDITTEPPIYANDGVAYCTFTAISEEELAALGGDVEGTERIQATATVDVEELTDTVNIRVTTGPIGIVIEPVSEEDDRVLAAGAGVESNLKLYVVKADYELHVEYDSPITLSADGPGTLSETTITSVPTDGASFMLASDGTPGIVEITASAPDLDIGYIEITFTGEPASIIITPGKKSIYPGEEIDITVTIVDENKIPLEFSKTVTLEALIDGELTTYGILGGISNSISLDPVDEDFSESTFKATFDSPVGETITIQANAEGDLSGSTEITILSSLTPYYLDIIAYPSDVNLEEENSTIVTAEVYDDSGNDKVITYNTPITFSTNFGLFPNNDITQDITPSDGEAVVVLSSTAAGTAIIIASSGSLELRPEGGIEVAFYDLADHIVLSADPTSLEADGVQTSIIKATVRDAGGNKVANYVGSITFETNLGIFPDSLIDEQKTITVNDFGEGELWVRLSSSDIGEATVTATATDPFENVITIEIDGELLVSFTGDISSILTFKSVSNLDDYEIHFVIDVDVSPLFLKEIKVEWDNQQAALDTIVISSPFEDLDPLIINTTDGLTSPCTENTFDTKELVVNDSSDIGLLFSGAKMKDNNITVTFTDTNNTEYPISFTVPK